MKKGLFTAAVIAAMMMTQPVMAQEVVEQTEKLFNRQKRMFRSLIWLPIIRWKQIWLQR